MNKAERHEFMEANLLTEEEMVSIEKMTTFCSAVYALLDDGILPKQLYKELEGAMKRYEVYKEIEDVD